MTRKRKRKEKYPEGRDAKFGGFLALRQEGKEVIPELG
jgi:hypothetical protein